jgi:hypothetical protein
MKQISLKNSDRISDSGVDLYKALRKYNNKSLSEASQKLKDRRQEKKKKKKFLLCANCKFIITSLEEGIKIKGQHKHTFKNPAGIVYTIGCFSSAKGCIKYGEPTTQYTWFPGFAWNYALCGNCFVHLGWVFQSSDSGFYGLILNHLTEGEKDEDVKR